MTKKHLKEKVLEYAYQQHRENRKSGCYMGSFNIQALGDHLGIHEGEMKHRYYEALHELFIQNCIMKDPYHDSSAYTFTLTEKGKEIAEKGVDIDVYSLRLENCIENDTLLTKCQDPFNSGDYDIAVFAAYKLVEIRIREKACLPAELIGPKLISAALSPDGAGKLRFPTCKTKSETVGVLSLFSGAFMAFRNPEGHRIVDYEKPRTAARIIVFAELLLDLIEMAVRADEEGA